MKDMSQYMALWKQQQKVIMNLPNAVNVNLTGVWNTTLTASFFNAPQAFTPADTIIPISARQANNGSRPSVFTIPGSTPASNVVINFPRNAARAIFSVSATGQGNEEFWWSNVLQSNTQTYNASGATLFGFSPFREVQVLIDGQLAGVQWPFPVIFTGGVVPSFWSPMVGVDAFDLKEGEIDITPWLGVLCDGQSHNFTINVVGLNDTGGTTATLSSGVNSNWQVTGKVFVWLDSANTNAVTTGAAPTINGANPAILVSQSLTKNATGFNDTLTYTTSVSRQLIVSGSITTSSGTRIVSWTQTLTHTDNGVLSNQGATQLNSITTQGTDASNGGASPFSTTYSYPLTSNVTSATLANGTTRLDAVLSRSKILTSAGAGATSPNGLQLFSVLPKTASLKMAATTWSTTQFGTATLLQAPNPGSDNGSNSTGTQRQQLRFGGTPAAGWMGIEPDTELYFRDVSVSDSGRVLGLDVERLAGVNVVRDRPVATGSNVSTTNVTLVDAVDASGGNGGGGKSAGPGAGRLMGGGGDAALVVGS